MTPREQNEFKHEIEKELEIIKERVRYNEAANLLTGVIAIVSLALLITLVIAWGLPNAE